MEEGDLGTLQNIEDNKEEEKRHLGMQLELSSQSPRICLGSLLVRCLLYPVEPTVQCPHSRATVRVGTQECAMWRPHEARKLSHLLFYLVEIREANKTGLG